MSLGNLLPGDATEEVAALIATLHETGQRLEELTEGEVDAVAGHDGKAFLLRGAQEQLRDIEAARQAAILNALPAHIALLDRRGLIIAVNDAWRRFAAANMLYGPGDAIGVNYLDICDRAHGHDAAGAREASAGIRAVLDGVTQNFSLEYPCDAPTERRWFLMTVTPLALDHPNGAVVMHVNITERKQIEEALQRQQTELRVLFDLLPAMIWFKDPENRILRVNKLAAEAVGKSVAEIEGRPSVEIYPHDAAKYYADDREVMLSGVPRLAIVEALRGRDGKERWVQTDKVPVRDKDGKVIGVCVMAQDVTERRLAAQELRESERRFSDMLRNVQLAAVMLDSEARITYCNEYFLHLTGWQYEEAIGRDWFELFMPAELGDRRLVFAALMANSSDEWHREDEIVTRAGARRLIRWNNSVLRSAAGDVIGTASIGEDITDRKEAQDRIAYLNRVLAMLSGINALIVRVRDREELFREACRLAVEAGGFRMAMIGIVDRSAMIVPAASAGKDEELLSAVRRLTSSREIASTTMFARAIGDKEAIVSNDSQTDPQVLLGTQYAAAGVCSMAILPLIVADEAVGVIALYASEREFFHAEEMALLTELATDISFGLETIGREEKIARLSRIQAFTSGINSAIVRVRSRQQLFTEACQIAVEHGGFGMAWIGTLNSETSEITSHACAGIESEFLMNYKTTVLPGSPTGEGELGRAIREKRAVFSNDLAATPDVGGERRQDAIRHGYRSSVALPLLVSGAVIGTLTLFAWEPDFFNTDELILLEELAANIAFAVDHIDQDEKIIRLSRVKAVMSGINSLIVRVRDLQHLFDEACRIAVASGGFEIAWIGRFDPVTQDITPMAWAGIDSRISNTRRSSRADIPEGQGLSGRAVRERRAVFDNDIARRPGIGGWGRKEAIGRGYRSLVALPLLADGTVLGTLSLFAGEAGFFDAEELTLLTELADNVAFAIANIDRQEKLAKLSRIRAVSGDVNAAIVRIHEGEALLQEVCRIAADYGKFELVWVASIDAERQEIRPVAWRGFSAQAVHAVKLVNLSAGTSPLAEAMQTKRPAVRSEFSSAGAATPLLQEAFERGCNSTVCLPLLVDAKVVSVISLFAAGRNFFDDNELALLTEVAADVSLALQSIARREQLDHLAYYDALTGLANRALFHERLEQGVATAKKLGRKISLLLLDIERFKIINDTLGRQAGDGLLREVAARALVYVADAGLLARLDADHFAVMVTDVQTEEELARLIEQRIGEIFVPPFRIGDSELRVSARFGIAVYPADGDNADTLVRNAEAALENAKARGDRYLFYTQSMNERVAEKLSLENRLRQAIEREEFVLHYQPKVNFASGKVTGAEALIRWNDPQTGLVPPGHFIPMLEETGLIYEVGRWALRQAIADYLRWRAAGLPVVRIAVNVSPLQLRNRGFVAEVEQVIGVDVHAAAGLELEITESVIMDDVKKNIGSLEAIRTLGVTVAIDDFGTGFSSLSYLARLPVDTLKIDRSFVIDMTAAPEGLALVSTIISLAHALKLKVVAEGVETGEQSRLLRLLNCDEMQGYLFSKPVPAEIFETRFLAPHLDR